MGWPLYLRSQLPAVPAQAVARFSVIPSLTVLLIVGCDPTGGSVQTDDPPLTPSQLDVVETVLRWRLAREPDGEDPPALLADPRVAGMNSDSTPMMSVRETGWIAGGEPLLDDMFRRHGVPICVDREDCGAGTGSVLTFAAPIVGDGESGATVFLRELYLGPGMSGEEILRVRVDRAADGWRVRGHHPWMVSDFVGGQGR